MSSSSSSWPSALPSRFGSDRRLPDDYHDNNDDDVGLTSNHLQAGNSDHGGFHKQRIHEDNEEAISKMNTEFFALPGLPDSSPEIDLSSRDGRQMCSDSAWDASNCLGANSTGFELDSVPSRTGGLAEGSWVVPMLALAAVNVVVILAFEAFVVCKAYRNTPSRRHLFLGQMLLLGLLIGSLVGFAYATDPTEWSCAIIRLGTGFSYALIYSSLLVKLVFLITLNTGVYLPATYQALLFLFCMLVQVAIGLQWVLSSSSSVDSLCSYATRDHVLALFYVIFLVAFAAALALKSRRYRDNYREAKYIGAVMAVTVPVWAGWILATVVVTQEYHPACVGFGLLICCSLTFIIMFLPKSRQLSAIGKEGIYLEDQQEDRFSLHSGDGYSPSFYHFKPHKTVLTGGVHQQQHHGSLYKEARPDSPYFRAGNSYTGFHRPLRVVPPSATTPSNGTDGHAHAQHRHAHHQYRHLNGHARTAHAHAHSNSAHSGGTPNHHQQPLNAANLLRYPQYHPHSHHHAPVHPQPPPPPPPYTSRTNSNHFPSHFFPEKMYHYWQYYYHPNNGRMPAGIYTQGDMENIYTSLHDPDRTNSNANPNVYFYKTDSYHHPGLIY